MLHFSDMGLVSKIYVCYFSPSRIVKRIPYSMTSGIVSAFGLKNGILIVAYSGHINIARKVCGRAINSPRSRASYRNIDIISRLVDYSWDIDSASDRTYWDPVYKIVTLRGRTE